MTYSNRTRGALCNYYVTAVIPFGGWGKDAELKGCPIQHIADVRCTSNDVYLTTAPQPQYTRRMSRRHLGHVSEVSEAAVVTRAWLEARYARMIWIFDCCNWSHTMKRSHHTKGQKKFQDCIRTTWQHFLLFKSYYTYYQMCVSEQ